MTRQLTIILSALLILGASFGLMQLLSSQKEEQKQPPAQEAKRYVKTAKVAYTNIPTELAVYGRVASTTPLDLIAEGQGRLLQGGVQLKEGQHFRKGDLLVSIDQTERTFGLKAQKSTFMRDLASILPDFKIDFSESYADWYAYFQSIDVEKPLPNLPKYRNDKEKTYLATKNILSSFYTIKSQEVSLEKFNVYAPFDGSIVEVLMQIGSFVNPGSRVARLVKSSSLELKASVDVKDVRWVKEGAMVNVATEDGKQQWPGRVLRISEILNPNTQALDVYIQLTTGNTKIYEGMYLKAIIPGGEVSGAMEIPRAALVGNAQVYTVQDTLLKVRPITLHKLNAQTAIVSGLEEGEDLVVESLMSAYEDMKVFQIKNGQAPKGEQPAAAKAGQ